MFVLTYQRQNIFNVLLEITFIFHIVSETNGLQDYKSHETVMSRWQQSCAKFISIAWNKMAQDLDEIVSVVLTAGDYY